MTSPMFLQPQAALVTCTICKEDTDDFDLTLAHGKCGKVWHTSCVLGWLEDTQRWVSCPEAECLKSHIRKRNSATNWRLTAPGLENDDPFGSETDFVSLEPTIAKNHYPLSLRPRTPVSGSALHGLYKTLTGLGPKLRMGTTIEYPHIDTSGPQSSINKQASCEA